MQCDECGAAFEPTPENPGRTTVAGYADNAARVEAIRLCDAHVAWFHALELDAQHAAVTAIRARQAGEAGE